jgi:hypothetical protein
MLKGDISNEIPKRVLVTTDAFSYIEPSIKKKFRVIPVIHKDLKIRQDILSKFYLFTTHKGVTLELISYELSNDELQELMLTLDALGTNPFRYHNYYPSIEGLMKILPYRPEVVGVIDKPGNLLRYGHWGMDFNYL